MKVSEIIYKLIPYADEGGDPEIVLPCGCVLRAIEPNDKGELQATCRLCVDNGCLKVDCECQES